MSKENMYITGQDAFKAYASQLNTDVSESTVQRGTIARTVGRRTFDNFNNNVSVRSDYNRNDYEYFRPSYTVPTEQKQIIASCMESYQRVGLVRNVIDLMGDFGSQGIRIQHSVPSIQKFYNSWWKNVEGGRISERFLNLLYRAGQVVIKSSYGKVSVGDESKWKRSKAEEFSIEKTKIYKREIPLKYTFIDILSLEILGKDLAPFVGNPTLAMKVSPKLRSAISTALAAGKEVAPEVKKMLDKIPKDVADAIINGKQYIPLDYNRTSVFYYKKDDWMAWANPMCYAILHDLMMLQQLKLADISALDGAISNIRLWKLGIIGDSPNNSILPTKAAINKLRSILANNVGGGVLDLVWGPELSFEESNSQVWRFLGSEKYATTINAIYEGLGIPAPLRAGSGQSNTGNFVGLNTLIKRLQYGRNRLIEFWNHEIKVVHKAMDFAGEPPQIVFDFMVLADEAAEKQLLIHLWDRDIISSETILELFGRLPNIEKSRVKKESDDRDSGSMPEKASPYHNPEKEHDYKKILLQGGGVAPSEIGMEMQPKKSDEKNRLEQMEVSQLKLKKLEVKNRESTQISSPAGRPKNVTETKKRKPKPTEKPSTKAGFVNMFLWANNAQEQISDLVTKPFLDSLEKPNMRSLSREEFDLVEKIKLDILCDSEPFQEITQEFVQNSLVNGNRGNNLVYGAIKTLKTQFVAQNNRNPKIEELRQIYASAYALINEIDEEY
jgi:hypothetical protein